MYSVTLRNGVEMPLLGYGVLQMKDQEECRKSFTMLIRQRLSESYYLHGEK